VNATEQPEDIGLENKRKTFAAEDAEERHRAVQLEKYIPKKEHGALKHISVIGIYGIYCLVFLCREQSSLWTLNLDSEEEECPLQNLSSEDT
ncbi:hypothetical protein ACJX0J_019055, partial [Zea mays]